MKDELLKLLAGSWAIEPKKFENLCSSDWGETPLKPSGEPNHRNNVDMVGDIAVMHIDDVLTYRSTLMKMWYGMDTYNSIAESLDKLLADSSVNGIVLSIHSPGGQLDGVSDLAEKIYNARGSKSKGIVAHTAGSMCSAAYWIGSACEKVFASATAIIGSIGVMASVPNAAQDEQKYVVSNLSRNKNLDPNTPEGRAALEKTIDASAKVFVESVAKHRGTTFEDVLGNYGQGGLFVGEEAVKNGMIDGIVSLDSLIDNMSNNNGGYMPNPNANAQTPVLSAEEQVKAAVAAERSRIAGINTAFEGLGLEGDCKKFIDEGKTVAEAESFALTACKKQLADAKATPAAAPAASATEQNANLTAEQQALIAAGMQANASAANGVQAGAANQATAQAEADKAAYDAFAAGSKIF